VQSAKAVMSLNTNIKTAMSDEFDGRLIAARAIDKTQKAVIAKAYDVLLDVRKILPLGTPLRDRARAAIDAIEGMEQRKVEQP
jgi:hypothetical protein